MLRDGTAVEAGFYPDRIERIRERAPQWLERGPARSLVLLAARRGVVALNDAYGVARYDSTESLSHDAVFWTASLTKAVTATAVMMLVEDGAFSLNRALKDFFPELTGAYSDRILVHQLLTHTSGYADDTGPIREAEGSVPEGQHPVIHARLESIYQRDCLKKPGEQNIYCTGNFLLLGELVRRVSGQPLDRFVGDHIFAPLGMTSSTIGRNLHEEPRWVAPDPALLPPNLDADSAKHFMSAPSGDAGLFSTAGDLAIFLELHRRGGEYGGVRLLNDSTIAEMTRNQIPGIGCVGWFGGWIPEASWGLGWMIQGDARWRESHGMLQPRGSYYHQGGSGCAFWVDPVNDLVGVYLSFAAMDMEAGAPDWEFDTFQNMLTAAADHGA